MSKLLRVDMGAQKIVFIEELGEYADFGGRGLTSVIVSKEVPPTCHPLGEKNKLVFAPGILSGTTAANSGRLSIGAKSPLTGGIKESNVGGTAAAKLARLQINGIIVEGKAPEKEIHYLLINEDGAALHSAEEYKGMKNYDLAEKLKAKHGEKVTVVSIGPAGEMRLAASSVAVTDTKGRPSRHAGRGGLGAVMGSKGLKAIVIDDTGAPGVEYADKEAFTEAAKVFRDALTSHDVTKPGGGLATYGTAVLVNVINEAGALPTRNFTSGRFEGAEKISGEAIHDIIEERGGSTTHSGCTNCIIQCSNIYLDKAKNYLTGGLEYETIWAFGADCGVDDPDIIAQADRLCDDIGLDTIEIGSTIAVAMAGGLLSFGDGEGMLDLIRQAGDGTPLGRIIGSGVASAGRVFGVTDVPVVKSQSMPAYDPRAVKGVGVTYATSPMGADHTSGYAVATNIMRVGGFVDPLKSEGQAELSRNLQISTAFLDSAGLCVFVAFAILDIEEGFKAIPKMVSAKTGKNFTVDDLLKYGRDVIRAERNFNFAAGFTKFDDRLPEFFKEKKLPPHDVIFDVTDDELDSVHDY